jgi:hypothetical protein
MAASDPAGAHPAAADESVTLDRLFGVARTGRLVSTTGGQPAEDDAIELDEADADPTRHPCHLVAEPVELSMTPPRVRSRRTAPTSVSWSAATTAGRQMISTSQPGWNEGAITLSTSRIRRRTRLRTTAPPSRRPVDNPNLVSGRPVRRNRTLSRGWDRIDPSRCNASKSRGLEIITSRGARWPRPSVRPSAACALVPGGRRARGGPPSSSSGRGSRAPWRDAASSAGRSASSGEPAILSIGLWAYSVRTPRGTRTRRAPVSAWRVVVRRMICRAESECQTSVDRGRAGKAPGRGSKID